MSYHFRAGHFRLDSFERPFLAITNSCIGLSSTRFLSLSQKAEQLQRRGEVLEGIQALNPRARCVLQAKIMLLRSKKKRLNLGVFMGCLVLFTEHPILTTDHGSSRARGVRLAFLGVALEDADESFC